jgi:hypothetical protein
VKLSKSAQVVAFGTADAQSDPRLIAALTRGTGSSLVHTREFATGSDTVKLTGNFTII